MNELVVQLGKLNRQLEAVNSKYEDTYADWVRDHMDLITQQEDLKQQISAKREEIKRAAIEQYTQNGEKKPHPAISIREYTRYRYEESEALEWAETHVPIIVHRVLDTKTYERFLKDQKYDSMPGEIYIEPVPSISKDLSEFIE